MKLIKSILAATLALAASSGFAVELRDIVAPESNVASEALRVWSSACVGNLEIEDGVAGQYKWGEQGEWQEINFENNHLYIFSQRFPTDVQPMTLTVKFMSSGADDAVELTYDLAQTTTRFRQHGCQNIENYRFEAADDGASRDLVHVE